jgi:triphosphoribosyl-dephospho-CoA synthase
MRCINLASLLEVSGWPKPGNVHRTRDFEFTRFEHFLSAISAIQPNFRKFSQKIFEIDERQNYSYIELGFFFRAAVEQMMNWQSGGNVLLGHILILGPLTAAATLCIKFNANKLSDLKYYLNRIIEESTVDDTINLYNAIRLCNPGGLGTVTKYDVNNENAFNDIRNDNMNLKKIFEFSKDYDLISSEYSSGFRIILNEGLPYLFKMYRDYTDPNIATVNTFLKILSLHPDSLIIRKSGNDSAQFVSDFALKILQEGGISSQRGLELTNELDRKLHEKKGEMNPGTTADLIAGILFCALIFGLKL